MPLPYMTHKVPFCCIILTLFNIFNISPHLLYCIKNIEKR